MYKYFMNKSIYRWKKWKHYNSQVYWHHHKQDLKIIIIAQWKKVETFALIMKNKQISYNFQEIIVIDLYQINANKKVVRIQSSLKVSMKIRMIRRKLFSLKSIITLLKIAQENQINMV